MEKKRWGLILMALCLALAFSVSPAEAQKEKEQQKEKGNQKCTDNIDNDGDGDIDSADSDCSGVGGGDPEFFVELVDIDDAVHLDFDFDSSELEVCSNVASSNPTLNIVIGEDGSAFVPNDSSSIMTRFNTIGDRTFLDITWPGRDGICDNNDDFEAERGSILLERDQDGNITTFTEYTAFFTDQNAKKGASLTDTPVGLLNEGEDRLAVTDESGNALEVPLNEHIGDCTFDKDLVGPANPVCFIVHLHLDGALVTTQGGRRPVGRASMGDLVFYRVQ